MTETFRSESARELAKRLRGMDVAMLTTVDASGRLHSRPMLAQQLDPDGELWFFTSRDTHKADDIRERPQVNVCYAEPREGRYVSVTGQAEPVEDPDRMRELWKPEFRSWFPDGVQDPDLVLLRVRIDGADCWDGDRIIHIPGPSGVGVE